MMTTNSKVELATLGGGCFWCLEAVFVELQGVGKVVSGYSGGPSASPTYDEVCSGMTGHAEVVQITLDPDVITFRQILEVFFSVHDPTTLNRQGNDAGTQYRSVIFYHSGDQKRAAEQTIKELTDQRGVSAPIVTEVSPLTVFYPAEDYHQDYFKRNPGQGYCRAIIQPKVAKFRKQFHECLWPEPGP